MAREGFAKVDGREAAKSESARWRRRRRLLLLLLAAVALFALRFRRSLFEGNFGVVWADSVYRSAQPGRELADLIDRHRLATVLDLRGGSPTDPFYDNEVRVTGARGVDFYDLPMSAVRRPTRRELLLLIDLFGRCRYPLLIHCKQGADRTGLATAVYLLSVRGVDPAEARRAFSLDYGHVAFWGPETLHGPIDEYGEWLSSTGQTHTPGRLHQWVLHEYRSADPHAEPRPLRSGPREPRTGLGPAGVLR